MQVIQKFISHHVHFPSVDGQSIATRLAKRITTAHESLKKALNKYNKISADTYEGCLYNLPEVLTWESVSNMEELTLVEINSMAGKSVVLMETFLKAIRMFNMAKRAEEEESLLNEER